MRDGPLGLEFGLLGIVWVTPYPLQTGWPWGSWCFISVPAIRWEGCLRLHSVLHTLFCTALSACASFFCLSPRSLSRPCEENMGQCTHNQNKSQRTLFSLCLSLPISQLLLVPCEFSFCLSPLICGLIIWNDSHDFFVVIKKKKLKHRLRTCISVFVVLYMWIVLLFLLLVLGIEAGGA